MKFNLLKALKKFLAKKTYEPLLEPKTIYPPKDPDGDAGACGIGLPTEESRLKDIKEGYKRMIEEFNNDPKLNTIEQVTTGTIKHWEQLGYVDREENSPSAETAPALRTTLISDKLENAMNLPSPEDIKEREIDMKFDLLEALKKFLANKNCKPPLETKTIYPRKDPDGDAGACLIKLS